ncbi:MAG TPA: hypothetical protein VN641_08485 [Urbifossiella sp.]|nr:hypothetical protein [Urbifossiella sp.]
MAYGRQANDHELETWAAEIKLRALRRLGELSKGLEKAKPGGARNGKKGGIESPPGGLSKEQALDDAGLSKQQASRCETIASVPEEVFESIIDEAKATKRRRTSRPPTAKFLAEQPCAMRYKRYLVLRLHKKWSGYRGYCYVLGRERGINVANTIAAECKALKLFATTDAVHCELVLPIPEVIATAEEAGIPRIVAEAIAELGKMPEVVKHRQATSTAKDIESKMNECRDQIATLASRRTAAEEAADFDEVFALSAAMRTKQDELATLKANADLIEPIARTLAAQARQAVTNAANDRLYNHRSDAGQAANAATEHATGLLKPIAAEMEKLASSPKAIAAITAYTAARRADAAKGLLNSATDSIIKEALAALELD